MWNYYRGGGGFPKTVGFYTAAIGGISDYTARKIILSRHFKGVCSIVEMDHLPLYELQTLYYQYWVEKVAEKEAESKMSEDDKAAKGLSTLMEEMQG